MSKPKFTQGPWYVYNNGFYLEITNESGQEAPTISISDIHDKNMSNANLIAAAPDMYEALEDIINQAKKTKMPIPADLADSIHILGERALRKARGETE